MNETRGFAQVDVLNYSIIEKFESSADGTTAGTNSFESPTPPRVLARAILSRILSYLDWSFFDTEGTT